MSMADIVADRLRIVVADGFDIFKYQKRHLVFTKIQSFLSQKI